jgi:hypothetical protein
VVNQHHINVEYMRKNSEYFGEALAMCEEFGLIPLMQFVHNWDEELVVQFYSTVYFTEDDDRTIKWLTNGRLLEATWEEFGDSLGYPILDTSKDEDANGWRCHYSDYVDHKDTMAPLYIWGHENPDKTSTLAPEYHILLRIYRENIAAKVGNFDEVHGFIVNLMVNSHKMKGTGVPLDVMDFLYNELYFGVIEKRSCPYAPFVMKLICDTWLKTFKTNIGATEHLNLTFHEVNRIRIMAHLPPRRLEMLPLRATVMMRILLFLSLVGPRGS